MRSANVLSRSCAFPYEKPCFAHVGGYIEQGKFKLTYQHFSGQTCAPSSGTLDWSVPIWWRLLSVGNYSFGHFLYRPRSPTEGRAGWIAFITPTVVVHTDAGADDWLPIDLFCFQCNSSSSRVQAPGSIHSRYLIWFESFHLTCLQYVRARQKTILLPYQLDCERLCNPSTVFPF